MERQVVFITRDDVYRAVGKKFYKWTVLSCDPQEDVPKSLMLARCRCDCGLEKDVKIYRLLLGHTKMCRKCSYETFNQIFVTHEGMTKTMKEWAEHYQIEESKLRMCCRKCTKGNKLVYKLDRFAGCVEKFLKLKEENNDK